MFYRAIFENFGSGPQIHPNTCFGHFAQLIFFHQKFVIFSKINSARNRCTLAERAQYCARFCVTRRHIIYYRCKNAENSMHAQHEYSDFQYNIPIAKTRKSQNYVIKTQCLPRTIASGYLFAYNMRDDNKNQQRKNK